MLKTKDTTTSLLLLVVPTTAVRSVLLIALQNGWCFTGKVIKEKGKIRVFSVFSF